MVDWGTRPAQANAGAGDREQSQLPLAAQVAGRVQLFELEHVYRLNKHCEQPGLPV